MNPAWTADYMNKPIDTVIIMAEINRVLANTDLLNE